MGYVRKLSLSYKLKYNSILCMNVGKAENDVVDDNHIQSILREQGLTMEDIKRLKTAIFSGQRYNERSASSPPSPKVSSLSQEKIEIAQKSLSPPPSTKEISYQQDPKIENAIKNVGSRSSSPPSLKIKIRPKTLNKDMIASSPILSTSSSNTINISMSEPNIKRVQNNAANTDVSNAVSKTISTSSSSSNHGKSRPDAYIPLDGVTLEAMLKELIAEYGFTYMYEETNLRCFSVSPSIASSLKILRQPDLLWARKKVEALYLNLMKQKS